MLVPIREFVFKDSKLMIKGVVGARGRIVISLDLLDKDSTSGYSI